jgi:hypothetical protein
MRGTAIAVKDLELRFNLLYGGKGGSLPYLIATAAASPGSHRSCRLDSGQGLEPSPGRYNELCEKPSLS